MKRVWISIGHLNTETEIIGASFDQQALFTSSLEWELEENTEIYNESWSKKFITKEFRNYENYILDLLKNKDLVVNYQFVQDNLWTLKCKMSVAFFHHASEWATFEIEESIMIPENL